MQELFKNYNIIIIPPSKLNKWKYLIFRKGWQWVFMGSDSCLREAVIKELGELNRHYYAKELQNISIKYKKDFLDWIAKLGDIQNKSFWWATNMAYKSPLASDLFYMYCCLLLVQSWINKGAKKRILIIENPWLIKTCLYNFKNQNVFVVNDTRYFVKNWVKNQCFSYARIFLFLIYSIKMWLVNKIYVVRYKNQIEKIIKDKIDILIWTWIEDRSFKEKNIFSDPYLGSLKDYYAKKGFKIITTTLPIFPHRLLKKTYQSGDVIPSIYFGKFKYIFKSFFKAIFLRWNRKIPDITGLNLEPLFNYEKILEKGKICYVFFHYLIIFNIFNYKRMFCNIVVYPFENQPWDKMLVKGMRDAQSKCKIIGCHNISIPFFYLNFFLGEGEGRVQPQPDIVISNGKYWGTVLKDAGFSCPIKNGGSIRFSSNLKPPKQESSALKDTMNERNNNVLVLLSTSVKYSLDLLFYLLRMSTSNKNILIKPHPDTPEKVIKRYIKKLPDNFNYVDGSMEEWMEQVGWAIHVGSTAAIECMTKGIKVFKYLPERIDLDPLLGMDFRQNIVTDSDTLDFKYPENFEMPFNNLISEPFNEETWKSILNET